MSRLKRWTTAVVARVDEIVAQVENHEAMADSAIRDMQKAAARARVRMTGVRRDGDALRRRAGELRQAAARWRDRARDCASVDDERALECLRRADRADRQLPRLERRLEEHLRRQEALARDLCRIDERLGELRERRNLMRLRQSRAEALSAARGIDAVGGEVAEVFDRWDVRIAELEVDGAELSDVDALDAEYSEAEETERLLAQLEQLRREERS